MNGGIGLEDVDEGELISVALPEMKMAMVYLLLTTVAGNLPFTKTQHLLAEGLVYDLTVQLKEQNFDMEDALKRLHFALSMARRDERERERSDKSRDN